MGRITRAKAAQVAEKMHIDEDAVLELPSDAIDPALRTPLGTPSKLEQRPALGEIEPNSAGSAHTDIDLTPELRQSTRSKKKGGIMVKKTNNDNVALNASASTESLLAPTPEVVADEVEVVGSPASRAAADELIKDLPELGMSHLPLHDNRSQSPPSSAVKLTRSQLRDAQSGEDLAEVKAITTQLPQPSSQQDLETVPKLSSKFAEKMPNYLQNMSSSQVDLAKGGALSYMATSDALDLDQSTYDVLEAAVVEAQTPPKAGRMPSTNDDAIVEMDALDDAVEQVSAEVPDVQPSPQKPKPRKSSAPVVRMSKAAQARISLAQGKDISKPPVSSKNRASIAGLGQSRQVALASSKGAAEEVAERSDAVIPHSKPRPMSLQFPTPPPPSKSVKAPTRSMFRLPGEEVAAKLKAAKEARLARDPGDQAKKVFTARPAPASTKAPAVRQTSTSKARESVAAGGDEPKPKVFKARPAPKSNKTPEVRQTSASNARMSLISGNPTANASTGVRKRPNSVAMGRLSVVGGRPSIAKTSAAPDKSLNVSKRPATAMGTMNKSRSSIAPRASIAPLTKPKAAVTTSERPNYLNNSTRANGLSAASKGKEVFNRAANAKVSAEQQKREKEEAAKKARADAAERSRQLSRDWAEKQKLKKSGVKGDPKTKEIVAPVASSPVERETAFDGEGETVVNGEGETAVNGEAAVEA